MRLVLKRDDGAPQHDGLTHIYIYIHIYIHTYIYIYTYIYIQTHKQIYTYLSIYLSVHLHLHLYLYIVIYIYIFICPPSHLRLVLKRDDGASQHRGSDALGPRAAEGDQHHVARIGVYSHNALNRDRVDLR